MGKVTSKLQVTVPKAIAEEYRIKPGDEIVWVPSGDSIRVQRRGPRHAERRPEARLRLFDEATKRQQARQKESGATSTNGERGWRRDELYDRGRSR